MTEKLLNTKIATDITVKRYFEWEQNENKNEIANFVFKRLTERYIDPLKCEKKHGFLIMASCCLLIETYESFRQGWDSTDNKTTRIVKDTENGKNTTYYYYSQTFFTRENEFEIFKDYNRAYKFYKNIRCGLLHQGETTGGWKIRRKGELFNIEDKCINAELFLKNLEAVLENYREELKTTHWESSTWKNCRKKIGYIIKNCKPD